MPSSLRTERDGDVLRITMARRDRRNAFDAALIAELAEAFVAIGRALFSVAVPDRLLSLLVVLALGALCFAAMGLGITGLVRSSEGSSAVINAVYLPMAIISGTFFTPKAYPAFLRAIADVLPLTYFTTVMRDVMVRHHHIWSVAGSLAIVLGWGVVGLVAAIRGFRWQPREG